MTVFELAPDPSWTLEQWRTAAGKPTINELIEAGRSLTEVDIISAAAAQWRASTVQSWLNGHIAHYEDARAMIAVLRVCAQRVQSPLFDDTRLRAHADLFMRSEASRQGGFTPLSSDELAAIAGTPVPDADPRFNDADLLRKVYPPPPVIPYGREDDLRRLIDVMRESLITVIVSDPGNGKTTLAWHAARQAVRGGLVAGMDWNTDKRVMITAAGEERPTAAAGAPLRFETIISSAIRRFGWDDLRRASDLQLPALAAKRLSEGRYLLVVDNLETVPQSTQMVTDLRGLLEPRGDLAPLASRALLTSRVAVNDVPGVRHVHIGGLALEPTVALIRALEEDSGYPCMCTDSQIERLWMLTKGNPLLLQIALTRGLQQNIQLEDILNDLDNGAGFLTVFDRVFGPLVKTMSDENPRATFLAVYAALLPDLTHEALWRAWEREYFDGEPDFHATLSVVLRCGVLRPVPGSSGEYAIHPMIRRYLSSL
ncbi:MAG: hypothetical protein IPK52_08265 [Chloroflexi bacterium]|nr:hypothetical protein [Chloroflexota bacterium]